MATFACIWATIPKATAAWAHVGPRIKAKVEQRIREELAAGHGILKVAGIVGVGSGTVQRVAKALR
jgi:hypothetical protein